MIVVSVDSFPHFGKHCAVVPTQKITLFYNCVSFLLEVHELVKLSVLFLCGECGCVLHCILNSM